MVVSSSKNLGIQNSGSPAHVSGLCASREFSSMQAFSSVQSHISDITSEQRRLLKTTSFQVSSCYHHHCKFNTLVAGTTVQFYLILPLESTLLTFMLPVNMRLSRFSTLVWFLKEVVYMGVSSVVNLIATFC